jgi:ribosomal protein L30E
MKFIVIESGKTDEFERQVTMHLKSGWTIVGQITTRKHNAEGTEKMLVGMTKLDA